MIENSILQGSLVISEKKFIKRFGSVAGHRMFLIDAPAESIARVSDKLSSALRDYGMDIVPAGERLAMFSVVEHTYLKIFLLLGGLGLVLGTVGLGLVVLRNVLDRRGELGMLRAVGFDRRTLKRMVLYEHAGLLGAGLLFGVAAAAVAVGPVLKTPGAPVPYGWLMITIVCIAGSGVLWIWAATAIALGGNLLEAIRNE